MDPSTTNTQDDELPSTAFAGIEQALEGDDRQPGFDWEQQPLEGIDDDLVVDFLNADFEEPGNANVGTEEPGGVFEASVQTGMAQPSQSAVSREPELISDQAEEGDSGGANAQIMSPQQAVEQEAHVDFNGFDEFLTQQSRLGQTVADFATLDPQPEPESTVQAGSTQYSQGNSGFSSLPGEHVELREPEQAETQGIHTVQPSEQQGEEAHRPTVSETSFSNDNSEAHRPSETWNLQRSQRIFQSIVENGHMQGLARYMARSEPERLAALQRSQTAGVIASNPPNEVCFDLKRKSFHASANKRQVLQSHEHGTVQRGWSAGRSSDTVSYNADDVPKSWNDNLLPLNQHFQSPGSQWNPRKRKASDGQDDNLRSSQQAFKKAKTGEASASSDTQHAEPPRRRKPKETKNAPPEGGPAPHEVLADIEVGRIFNPICPSIPRPERRVKPFRNHPWEERTIPAGLRLTDICTRYPSYTTTSEVVWWFIEAGWSARQIIKMFSPECYRELSHSQPWSRWQQRMRWVRQEHAKGPEKFRSVAGQCIQNEDWEWTDEDAEGDDDYAYFGFNGTTADVEGGEEFEDEDEDQTGSVHAATEEANDPRVTPGQEDDSPERHLGTYGSAEGYDNLPALSNEASDTSQVPLTTGATRLGVTTGVWQPPRHAIDALKSLRTLKDDELNQMRRTVIKVVEDELPNLGESFALSGQWDLLSHRLRQDAVLQGLLCILASEWRARFDHNHNPEHFRDMRKFLEMERAAIYSKQVTKDQYLDEDILWTLLSDTFQEQEEYHRKLNETITLARKKNPHGNEFFRWFERYVSSRLSTPPNEEWQKLRRAWVARPPIQPRASKVSPSQSQASTAGSGRKRKSDEVNSEEGSHAESSTRPATKRTRRGEALSQEVSSSQQAQQQPYAPQRRRGRPPKAATTGNNSNLWPIGQGIKDANRGEEQPTQPSEPPQPFSLLTDDRARGVSGPEGDPDFSGWHETVLRQFEEMEGYSWIDVHCPRTLPREERLEIWDREMEHDWIPKNMPVW